MEGVVLGPLVGSKLCWVGPFEGDLEGMMLGDLLGEREGPKLGLREGSGVVSLGGRVRSVGEMVGLSLGAYTGVSL